MAIWHGSCDWIADQLKKSYMIQRRHSNVIGFLYWKYRHGYEELWKEE